MDTNQEELQNACIKIFNAIGENPKREGLIKTPERFAKAWKEITKGYLLDPKKFVTTFDGEKYDEMIIVRNIPFYSSCEHHLLPFFGNISIGYIPEEKIIGISKMPRLVEVFARRLQNQERLTMQIAESITEILCPKGVAVHISATHLCMQMRGVQKEGVKMETSAVRGIFRSDSRTRSEFFRLL